MPEQPIGDNFLVVYSTDDANKIDLSIYRPERYSKSRDAWLFVKRKNQKPIIKETKANFLQVSDITVANMVDLSDYRFEAFSEARSAWMFVRRAIK